MEFVGQEISRIRTQKLSIGLLGISAGFIPNSNKEAQKSKSEIKMRSFI
jgi:hypothetical protein